MPSFKPFSTKIHDRFEYLSKGELFVTISGDELWEAYLAAFPEGTNPIFRKRTQHDCGCCRNFVRNVGNVVSLHGEKISTVWDVKGLEHPYDVVAEKMDEVVRSHAITALFRTNQLQYGLDHNFETTESGEQLRWDHFHASINARHFARSPAQVVGDYATNVQVFKRGLEVLTIGALDTVIDLIEQKSLYRGDEFLSAVKEFCSMKVRYVVYSDAQKGIYLWSKAHLNNARFRNTVIGTLVQDLVAGVDLETAVRSFEQKVAPTNYKRPTALITKGMIQQAMTTIRELNLESALERRFAHIANISVNNVLWVDNSVQGQMKDSIEDLLTSAAKPKLANSKTATDISIEDFMASVLPTASALEVVVSNGHQGNFMSLTAPVYTDAEPIFKWDNGFAWSYDGNITDSIKEKVRKAGGNTNAKFRVSLAWHNLDDLDIHVVEPSGNKIYYGNKSGKLDVDMNVSADTREPVENVSWSAPQDGTYQVLVHNYTKRETSNVGFDIEIESNGALHHFRHERTVLPKRFIDVGYITLKDGQITDIKLSEGMKGGSVSKEKWGVKTEVSTKVEFIMQSPNHWDGQSVGNKHWFFILEGCKNPEPTRGIYNEYLRPSLEQHRKVFEVLGNKTMCEPTDSQLSGVGFSSTQRDSLTVIVNNSRTFNIQF